jgi:predicted O-methyltransferase YrrM
LPKFNIAASLSPEWPNTCPFKSRLGAERVRLVTTEYDTSIANRIHLQFSRKPGSSRIASELSLRHLSGLIRMRKPKSVLEIGSGIGTLSQLVLSHAESVENLFSIEQDLFCRAALLENLAIGNWQKWTLLHSHEELPRDANFDLIIFDGYQYAPAVFDLLHAGTAVFVEGKRQRTRDELADYARRKGLDLHLHEHKGSWYIGWRRMNGSRALPKLVLKRDQCHEGICITRCSGCCMERDRTPEHAVAAGPAAT